MKLIPALRPVYIEQSEFDQSLGIHMLLLTNCEVHAGKHSDRSFEVRTERKAKARIFFRMDRINWSITALLFCNNQRPKLSLNSYLNIFVSSLNVGVGRESFFNSSISE